MSVAGAPAVLALFDIGPMEFLMILGAAVMLFGGDLPDVARKAGRTVRKLRTLAAEVTKNLDLPTDITRLPGAAEFREGLDMKDDLDLRKDADIDWREGARLPAPGAAAAPTTPESRDQGTPEHDMAPPPDRTTDS